MFQGALIANMLMGMVVLKKRYTPREYVSIVLISIGIGICTYVSSHTNHKYTSASSHSQNETVTDSVTNQVSHHDEYVEFFWLMVGKY